jgi:glycosyltransferase involved in cell wall biosynthesis
MRDNSFNPKILYVIGQLTRGGAEQQLYYLLKHLKPQALVVSLSQGGCWADPIRDLGIEVIELKRRHRWDPSRLRELVKIIGKYRPEIVHVFLDNVPGLYGRLAALLAGHQCVISGERADTAVQQAYWYQLVKRVMNNQPAATVTNSRANLQYLARRRIANPQKLFFIPNGLELDRFVYKAASVPNGRSFSKPGNRLTVGTVASLTAVKAPNIFVRTAARVLENSPNTNFVYTGEGPLRNQMKALSAELGVQDRVSFPGLCNDIPQLLAGMDVFVLTSRSEGMPNAVMEAMGTGLPCVVTDAGDSRELVSDGETGFVAPVGDEKKIADCILALLNNEALRITMGQNGRKRIEAFDTKHMVEKYRELYCRVLDLR